VNQVWVAELPTDVVFPVLCRVGVLENEEPAPLRIELLGPEMSSYGELETELAATPAPDHRPGDEVPAIYPIELRFAVARAGNHSAEIYTDGRHQTSVFFVVRVEGEEDALVSG